MADVTISQLTPGVPSGNNILPYSTGSNTLGVPVSAILQNAGNIGIGTSNPNRALEVRGDGTNGSGRIRVSNSNDPAYEISDTNGIKGYLFYDTLGASNSIILRHAGIANQLVLNSAGNIGIGINNPQTKLTVAGTVSATAYRGGEFQYYNPKLLYSNAFADVTYNANRTGAYYRRIGNVVDVYGVIALTNKGSYTNNPFVTFETPIPCTGVTDFGNAGLGFPFSYIAYGLILPSNSRVNGGVITTNTSSFRPYISTNDDTGVRHIQYNDITNNFLIQYSYSYICA